MERHDDSDSPSARGVGSGPSGGVTAEAVSVKEEHGQPRYMAVWGALAVLTVIEVGVAFLGLPRSVTILALVGLAVWKALLVALYYMHLRFEPRMLRVLAAAPLIPAFILVVLVLLEY